MLKHSAVQFSSAALALAVLACAAGADGPARPASKAPTAFTAPEVRSEGFRFVVESVQQAHTWQVEFPGGKEAAGIGKATGRQLLYVRLAVYPPDPKQVPNIEGLESKLMGFTAENAAIAFRAWPPEDTNPFLAGVWRTQLMAQELDPNIDRLRGIEGALVLYPRAKVVTLEFPLNGKFPQTLQGEGFRATVKSASLKKNSLSAVMDTEWPGGVSVTRPNPDSPSGITAVSRAGTELFPNGGGSSSQDRGKLQTRQYSLTFTDVKEMPRSLRVQVLVRSGKLQRVPFRLPEFELPTSLPLEQHVTAAETGDEPLLDGHPLYSTAGGTLAFTLKKADQKTEGRLIIGLSRRAEGGFGPWRWVEAVVEPDGRVVVPNLQVGHYRVLRAWTLGALPVDAGTIPPATSLRLGEVAEVDIERGKTATLSPVGGTR